MALGGPSKAWVIMGYGLSRSAAAEDWGFGGPTGLWVMADYGFSQGSLWSLSIFNRTVLTSLAYPGRWVYEGDLPVVQMEHCLNREFEFGGVSRSLWRSSHYTIVHAAGLYDSKDSVELSYPHIFQPSPLSSQRVYNPFGCRRIGWWPSPRRSTGHTIIATHQGRR
ncbi:hypothetical protein FA13DRAFT_678066 [Coprinellus micaceus]|uniref:Uncharacterized protein n=1 Tax=Coprinellus micaceus TaxID=71717 RepID=A0A4Y7SA80_COPMI|nr:hypothetical protein FA13DRAFT_678066 [Coprinellus micaceus]